ncbi:MAG: hypothetical protein IJQ25_04015 [Oscillibacter sp.]|nr:hypothetical protein [Oscillibacter sp.]
MKRIFLGMLTVLAIVVAGVLLSGCLSVSRAAEFFPALQSSTRSTAGSVRADWSVLTPYVGGKTEYRYFSPYSGRANLTPCDNYGPLLPYIGAEMSLSGYVMDAIPLYGLVTADGQIVTAPVYTEVLTNYGPFLLLYRTDGADGQTRVTVAARDGSWVRDAGDWREFIPFDNRLAVSRADGSVQILDAAGGLAAEFSRDDLAPFLGDGYLWGDPMIGYIEGCALSYEHGYLTAAFYDEDSPWGNYWRYECFINPDSGTVSDTAPANWRPDDSWDYENPPEIAGYCYPEEVEDLTNGDIYYAAYPDCAERDGDWSLDLLDAEGTLLVEDCMTSSALQWRPVVADGMLGVVKDGAFTYTNISTGAVTFRYPLRTNSD